MFVEKLWLHLKKTIDVPEDVDSKLGETIGLTASRCTLVKDSSGNIGKYERQSVRVGGGHVIDLRCFNE